MFQCVYYNLIDSNNIIQGIILAFTVHILNILQLNAKVSETEGAFLAPQCNKALLDDLCDWWTGTILRHLKRKYKFHSFLHPYFSTSDYILLGLESL